MVACAYCTEASGESISETLAQRASQCSASSTPLAAACMATSAEEQAVSTLWDGPLSPSVNDRRPAAIEMLREVAANTVCAARPWS